MQTILLLGGFGFIASNILGYINDNLLGEYDVVIFDKYPEHHRHLTFKCVKKVYSGEFTDESNIIRIFEENKIDIVMHLLSSTVPATSSNAQYDVESNLIPTLRLLGIMDRYAVKNILYMSSGGAIYGDYLKKAHSENDAVYPKSSYGVVKLAIEKYLLSYAELYGFNTLILRLSNPYGKYHYNPKQGIVNIAIRKALRNDILNIWGTGEGQKDYIYIDDVCDIIFKLITDGVKTNVVNIANGKTHSVNEISTTIKNFIPSFEWIHIDASLVDVQNFELDITKLTTLIGKYKFTSFEEGIKDTIKWERDQLDK